MAVKRIAMTIAALAAVGLAGCATTHGNLGSSAERLEHSADELRADARDDNAHGAYYRDAQQFADEAHDFRRALADRDTDRGDVKAAFRDLSDRYHALRDEVERSSDRDADLDFSP